MDTDSTTQKLDSLGPIIVNVDGTLTRISNWASMSKDEQINATRLVSKRNEKRLKALKENIEEIKVEQNNDGQSDEILQIENA